MPQDFSHQNLRGRSFKGQNLAGANFSYADIRGTDFSGANLTGANFTGVTAGLQNLWLIFWIVISYILIILSSFLLATVSSWAIMLLEPKFTQTLTIFPGVIALILLALFFIVSIRYGLEIGFGTGAGLGAIALVTIGIVVVIFAGVGFGCVIEAIAIATTGILVTKKAGVIVSRLVAMVATGAIVWFWYLIVYPALFKIWFEAVPKFHVSIPIAIALVMAWLSSYMGVQALAKDEKFALVLKMAIAVTCIGGTSFRSANLTDAGFKQAKLQSTDFRSARLKRNYWFQAQKLDYARLGKSYFFNPKIQQLIITNNGQDKNFDHQNLRGINLKGADLADASFIGADLGEANLQDADLSRAKLVQTQLGGTYFTGATLTGAYIEDWNITTDTKFDGVRCEYVYMRLPTAYNPDPHRKPDNRQEVFADGEFGDFIKPIFDTLDLYHNQGVDPRAIAISFKQLAENHPDAELEIVAMEKRGQDKFLLRAKTAIAADKSELSAEYFDTYNQLKALAEQEVKALIAEKDSRIADLQNMVVTALQRPSFYAHTYQNQGDTIMPEGSKRESNFNLQGAQFGGGLVNADTVTAHQIGGNITNFTSAQNPNQTEPDNSAVKTILILASNPANTSPLRLDQEVREIDTGLQRSKKRELFDLKQRWAVRVQDVYQSFLALKPQFVHFSGHGAGDDGLVLEDETGNVHLVDTQALAGLFELFATSIECVVLNACYSEVQASAIAKHIPYVIGMNKEIGDQAAIKFATGFYNALGAGETVEFAYKLGCSVIQLEGIPENLTPVLKKK